MPDSGSRITIGVDTHQDAHVAVAVEVFGVEGTDSYGAGLARFLLHSGHRVVEVNRSDRATRYRVGKVMRPTRR